jgi:hypothetical protein
MSLQTSICYPPQACKKIKRYLPEMVGEKWEEWAYLISFCLRKTLLPLLNTTLIHSPGLGNPLPHSWPKSLDIFSRVMGVDFESFITKPSVVSLCVQEVCKQNIQLQNTYHSLCHHWVSPCSNISSTWTMISCCGLACDGSLSIDISTLSRELT